MNYNTLIACNSLARHIDDPQWVIFDCRFLLSDANAGTKAYARAHLPNARYVHLDNDLSSPVDKHTGRHPLPDFKRLAEKLGRWGLSNKMQAVVYDDAGGAIAGRLWWLLRCLGHTAVALLDGGINQWQRENRPLTAALPAIEPKIYRPYLNSSMWLTVDELQLALKKQTIKLIDARTPERYRGEQEPIDPVAGHIPSALNRPFQSNLDRHALFLNNNALRNQYRQLIGDTHPSQIVHMCGSGVTACHNLLAMEIAGLSGSRLYAGSWSEWIKDKQRPIATLD